MFRLFYSKSKTTDANVYKQHLSRLQNAKSKVDSNIYKHSKAAPPITIKREQLYALQGNNDELKKPTQPVAPAAEDIGKVTASLETPRGKMANFRTKSKSLIENALGKMFRSGQTKEAAHICADIRRNLHSKVEPKPASPTERSPRISAAKAHKGTAETTPTKQPAKKPPTTLTKQQTKADEPRVTLLQLNEKNNFQSSAFKIPETLINPPDDTREASIARERELVKVLEPSNKHVQKYKLPTFQQIPHETIEFYRDLTCGMAIYQLEHMLRPKIFLDLAIFKSKHQPRTSNRSERSRFVGRLIFQLYTEACPALVMELVRACFGNNKENISIESIYPGVWLEAQFTPKKSSLIKCSAMGTFKENMLSHKKCPGVLSFPKRCLNDAQKCAKIDFTISFERLAVPQGERIAFGVLEDGFDKLGMLSKLTDKNCTSIVLAECGVLQF